MDDEKNPADFVIGPRLADALEGTQINKFHTRGGAGFAAEEANALRDRFSGASVEQVGWTNELNGADRFVDGVPIQTKYYDNARSTLNAAFDGQGPYKYGSQLLEVPSDQYEECLTLMKEKIRQGKVPGLHDPDDAAAKIKPGVPYRQAKNIAAAGNIDSLWFDVQNQCVTTSYAFAISFSINFAKQKWDGKGTVEATKDSIVLGLQSGAASLVTGIVTAQILRTRAAAGGAVVARNGVKIVARTQFGRGFVDSVARASLGRGAASGAAATNHVAKLLRTNTITAVVTTVVISAPDFYRAAVHGSISWAQCSKNLAVNGVGVAGGVGGWMAGAAGGAAVGTAVPVIGTVVGAFVGGLLGAFSAGAAASAASKYVLDGLVEDDAKEMVRLLATYLEAVASDYLLSEMEVKELVSVVKEQVTGKFLREMYGCSDRRSFVDGHFAPVAERIIKKRPKITLPDPTEVQQVLDQVEEEALASEDEAPASDDEAPASEDEARASEDVPS